VNDKVNAFRDLPGYVYILENRLAKRVKVGMTTNNISGRIEDVNFMWLGLKVTCQICGGRRLINDIGLIPTHVLSGQKCPGSDSPPLEKEVALAEKHLLRLMEQLHKLVGSEKGSVARKIKTLKKRISFYQTPTLFLGEWKLSIAYYTKSAERVELLTHEILAKDIDIEAPFGEVFRCSPTEAVRAVEDALNKLGLLSSARRHSTANKSC
jgi:hypothetical protein